MFTQPSKTSTQHAFSQVPQAQIPRSSFNRSHGVKSSFNAGQLIPFFVDEALPGDTFNLRATLFARMATPIAPIMDNLYLDTFFFAVPYRLVWDNWKKFNGEQKNPGDSIDYLIPQMQSPDTTGYQMGSLSDYFGIPCGVPGVRHSALWHRAYNAVWNEWFRDQNLQDSAIVDTGDADSLPSNYPIRYRGKRHDYFTSCLPWPQKGTAVQIPLGGSASVVRPSNSAPAARVMRVGTNTSAGSLAALQTNSTGYLSNGTYDFNLDPNGSLVADLSSATAATINSLRQAFQLQKMFERDARGGTRYTEIVLSHFGVHSPDARLQRPEYLGGGSAPINIHPIAQTSESNVTPQGNLAAFVTATNSGNGFTKSFTEHTLLIGLCSVRADLNYQQGLNRMWSRKTRYDFYWPSLSHLGEQAVLNKEIYLQGNTNDDAVFGYQERYAEYRYKPSIITGMLNSNYSSPLDMWHLAQDFAALPVLNDTFIKENPPMDRILAVTSGHQFIFDGYIDLKCARPMPIYSVPGLIDHF